VSTVFGSRGLVLLAGLACFAVGGYRWLSHRAAPDRIQRVVQHYTGLSSVLGATVLDVRTQLKADFQFVPNLGYVTRVRDSSGISEMRLLLRPGRHSSRNDADRVDAVEIVTGARDALTTLELDLSRMFPGAPKEGCLTLAEPGNYREVRYWTIGRRGGVALTNDFGGNKVRRHPGMVIAGMLAFAGPFRGGATLRGNYSEQSCAVLSGMVR
jgi:hypothetical protein